MIERLSIISLKFANADLLIDFLSRPCLPYGLMKSAIVVMQEETNIENILSVTIIYIHGLEMKLAEFMRQNSTNVTNDLFPHRLFPARRGHRTDINRSSI